MPVHGPPAVLPASLEGCGERPVVGQLLDQRPQPPRRTDGFVGGEVADRVEEVDAEVVQQVERETPAVAIYQLGEGEASGLCVTWP